VRLAPSDTRIDELLVGADQALVMRPSSGFGA